MKLAIDREELLKGLRVANRAVATRSAYQVLSHVLMIAGPGGLDLHATNLELRIGLRLEACDVEEDGAIVVPAKLLTQFVSALEVSTDVHMVTNDEACALKVTAGRHRTTIKGLPATDFPEAAGWPEHWVAFDMWVLSDMVRKVAFAAAKDESRPVLMGVHLSTRAGTLMAETADGFRLARFDTGVRVEHDVDVIVPATSFSEMAALVNVGVDRAKLYVNERMVGLMAHEGSVQAQLINGTFPDADAIIPGSWSTRAVVDRAAMLAAVRVAMLFARDAANIVRFKFAGDIVNVSGQSVETGDAGSEVPVELEGDAIEIAFNGRYVMDCLNAMDSDDVVMEFASASRPVKITGDAGFVYVLMPMALK